MRCVGPLPTLMTYKVKMRIAKPLLAFQTQASAIFIQFKLNVKQPADCFILLKPQSET